MTTPVRIGAFVAVLAVVLVASYGVGSAVGPVGVEPAPDHGDDHAEGSAPSTTVGPDAGDPGGAPRPTPAGSVRGFRLQLDPVSADEGATTVVFRIAGPDGATVTAFDPAAEQPHLVAVGADGTPFLVAHPAMAADGTWTAPLALTPGAWRFVVTVTPTALGEPVTLRADAVIDEGPRHSMSDHLTGHGS